VQDAVGRAEATLAAARAYLFAIIGDIWSTMERSEELSVRQTAQLEMVNAHVYSMCTQAVEMVYKVRGGSSVYSSGPLDRLLRDALTMNQHVINSLRSYGMAGRILLGLPPEQYVY
jgi:indole-3-acetate monooxygenase